MVNTNLINRFFNQVPIMQQNMPKEQLEAIRQFVKGLQIGESLEGILIKETSLGYVLEVNEEIRIPVSILESASLGSLLKFTVMSKKQGEVQLKIQHQEPISLIEKVTKDLGLPRDEIMGKCINHFMDKELTFIREDLIHTHYLHKYYQIPSEVITNVLARKSGITEADVNTLSLLKQQGLTEAVSQLKQILIEITKDDKVGDLISLFRKYATKEEVIGILEDVLRTMPKAHTKEIQESNLLSDSLKEVWKKLGREEKGFVVEKLLDHFIGINPKGNVKLQNQLEINVHKFYEMIEYIEAKEKGGFYKEQISPLKEGLEVVQKLNDQGNYFVFPLLYQDKLNQAEVYFFEPKKRKQDKKYLTYVVIVLDLTALKHIEIHIHKTNKNLSLDIILENKEIKQWLMTYTDRLKTEIEQMGYTVEQCTYKVQSKTNNLIKSQEKDTSINHFDLKI